MEILNYIKKLLFEDDNKLLRNLVLIGMVGTIFLLFGNLFEDTNSPNPVKPPSHMTINQQEIDYASSLASELEDTLFRIQGVGKVKVQLSIATGPIYGYEYNQNEINKITKENDQNGGIRQIEEENLEQSLVIIRDVNGQEKPVVRYEKKPEITGVFIVAQGAEVSQIKYEIIRSVSSFLNLPVHKINVLPYQRR